MTVDVAKLALDVDTRKLKAAERDQDKFARSSGDMERKTGKATDGIGKGFGLMAKAAAAAAAAMVAVGAGIVSAVREAEKFQTTMFRVEAVIKATGGAAGRSADQLREQARQIALGTLESTEGVLRAQQTLLTFRKVQGDVFDRAIVAAADMTAALGGDLNSNAVMLGKALEDPITGMSALTRTGTVFTDAQKDIVKAMVETGNAAGAQAFILAELEAQYGGVAEAAGEGLAGAQDTLAQSFQELRLELADSLGLLTAATAANRALAAIVDTVARNIDDARGFILAAAIGITAYYTPAIVAATFNTGVWIASLITLRGALVMTGVGAFVVLAGMLINKFLELVEKTGGFGNAMTALGEIGTGVWNKIKAGGSFLAAELALVFNDIQFAWVTMTGNMASRWGAMMDNIAGTSLGEAMGLTGGNQAAAESGMAEAMGALTDRMVELQGQSTAARDAMNAPIAGLAELSAAADDAASAIADADDPESIVSALRDAGDAANELGGAAGGALKETVKMTKAATNAFKDFARQGIKGAVDWMVDGFEGGLDTLKDMFINTIKQMISFAISNQIIIGLGMGGAGMAAGAGIAAGAGMGGMLGGVLGGIGAFGGAVGTGMSVVGSGFAAGGLAGAGTAGAGAVAGGLGMGGLAGIGTAVGAAIPFVGAALLTIGLFSTKTKELDNGLNVAIDGLDVTAETFKKIEKSRFFGLSKSRSTSMRDDPDNPIIGAVNEVQGSIMDAARVLGVGASAFDDFSHKFKVSLKGLSEDEKIAAINAELGKMGDGFAQLVPGMESANQVLERAAQISAAVRGMISTPEFRTLEDQIFAVSQQGNLRQQTQSLDAPTTRADERETQNILKSLIQEVRDGNINSGLLQSKLVALQQRAELAPT